LSDGPDKDMPTDAQELPVQADARAFGGGTVVAFGTGAKRNDLAARLTQAASRDTSGDY